ncbi:hypothetical protein KSX_64020 [Ktedonospora formicarum]|uniref:Uncharacterized protein n=1 Tax=Ktedonospora formicarum TaxID=2778364 RepID=A0A8J3I2Q8_9CHLR|nr:hypothetical protein KSX_64020 [Ktedonospora formicarum]
MEVTERGITKMEFVARCGEVIGDKECLWQRIKGEPRRRLKHCAYIWKGLLSLSR